MNKVLSLIIPTYNMEKYLDKCLTSLVVDEKSVFETLEVIVVIDGSKDRSSEIAHRYQKRYPDVFLVIDKENGNYGSCVNRGLKEAHGEYVKILDADDYFDSLSLQKYLKYLSTIDADLVVTDFLKVDEDGKAIAKIDFDFPKETILEIDDICERGSFSKLEMHAVTYKRQNLIDIHYVQTEGISYTDQEWMFIPLTAVKKMVYFPAVVYCYLIGREGQTMDPKILARSIGQNIIVVENRLGELKKRNITLTSSMKNALYRRICRNITYIYRSVLLKGFLNMEDLRNFDQHIKDLNMEVYEMTNSVGMHPKIPLRFIKCYRKSFSNLPWYYVLLYRVCKVFK